MDAREIAAGLSEAQRVSVLAFAPAFAEQSTIGMKREWYDICLHTGRPRNYRNTIKPLLERDLAARDEQGLCYLTSLGLKVRSILTENAG